MIGARKLLATQASGAFSPDDISGLSSWLDASDTSTITHSGGVVSSWADKTANGNDATVTDNTVTTGSETLNGLNVLATTSLPRMSWFQPSSANATIFFVGRLSTTTGIRRIVSNYPGSGSLGSGVWLMDWTQTSSAVRFLRQSTNTSRTATRDTNSHIIVGQNSSSASLVRFDGNETAGSGYATAPSSTLYLLEDEPVVVSEHWLGTIAEILYYEAVLSASEIGSVETYLSDKWGITLA